MMKKSGQWPTAPERITATSIIHGIGPQKYDRNFRNALVWCSAISFGPYWLSRLVASAWLRPFDDVANCSSTFDIGSVFRSCWGSSGGATPESTESDVTVGRLVVPGPVADLRKVPAVLDGVEIVLNELVRHLLPEVVRGRAELRQPVDDVPDEMEPIEPVLHGTEGVQRIGTGQGRVVLALLGEDPRSGSVPMADEQLIVGRQGGQ